MAIFKCKMCGGTLEINNETVAVCEYCGTQQTLPKLDDERRANLYDRANHFRRNNEFDKAMGIYEQILNSDNTDAEAYWSIVLCHYGIEYVEDPATHKRIPTVNRAQYTSIFADENYKSALQYADGAQKAVYEAEAKAIDEIQKGILAISQKEEPFDVFICYKETDNNSRRTHDSVLANDLYHQLTQEGFKVFFARITLEDKLGSAYEPYIFAALNSAKVMVVIGTRPEFFNAVWVKNEWSRYLSLIRSGANKMLIPAYRDMDPYDLPEEFSHLQAQDMSKLGFMQDLIRGIKKIIHADEPKQTVVHETVISESNASIAPLLKRVFMFLEDGAWNDANDYAEKVLDIDPECADAYLGKLMAELRVNKRENLENLDKTFDEKNNYQKAVRFGDDTLVALLKNANCEIVYRAAVNKKNAARSEADFKEVAEIFAQIPGYKDADALVTECLNARLENLYSTAVDMKNSANSEKGFKEASKLFEQISGYKDADVLAKECLELAETARKDAIYDEAKQHMSAHSVLRQNRAISRFEQIPGYRDADELIAKCRENIENIKRKEEEARIAAEAQAKKTKKIAIISAAVFAVIIAIVLVVVLVIVPTVKYNNAVALFEAEKYEEAITAFTELGDYKDSVAQIDVCKTAILEQEYDAAVALYEEGKYEEAITAFEALDGYKDSETKITECTTTILDGKYNDAVALMDAGKLDEAYTIFIELGDYKDATDKAGDIKLQKTKDQLKNIKVGSYVNFGAYEQDNNTSNGKEDVEWLVLEIKDGKALVISKYALDCEPYNTSFDFVTWKTCTLRTWLNNDFLGAAFSADEKAMIPTVTVSPDKNPIYDVNPGNATQDRVFLLSITEANKYFNSNSERQYKPTDYAVANGVYFSGSNGNCWWWLRSPGNGQSRAASVLSDGGVDEYGHSVNHGITAVRPALWIELPE